MSTNQTFLAKKSIGFYILLGAIFFAILSFITYLVYHPGEVVTWVNPAVVTMLVFAIVSGLVFGYKNFFGAGSIVVTIFVSAALGVLIRDHINNLAYIYYGTGFYGDYMPPALTATLVFFGLMFVTSLASAFFKIEKAEAVQATNKSNAVYDKAEVSESTEEESSEVKESEIENSKEETES